MTKLPIFLLAVASASIEAFSPSTHTRSHVREVTELFMNKKKSKKKPAKKKSGGQGFGGAMAPRSSFPYAGTIRPGIITEQRIVADEKIITPDYALDGIPKKKGSQFLPWIIEVKTADEIEKMRAAGKLAREVLDLAGGAVAPGVTTDEIDTIVHEATIKVCLHVRRIAHKIDTLLTYERLFVGWCLPVSIELPRLSKIMLHKCQ